MTTAHTAACTCRSDIQEKLAERFAKQAPEATGHEVKLMNYAIVFGESVSSRPYMPIECTATFPLKKGGVKNKTQKQNMFFSFCPFCGQELSSKATA